MHQTSADRLIKCYGESRDLRRIIRTKTALVGNGTRDRTAPARYASVRCFPLLVPIDVVALRVIRIIAHILLAVDLYRVRPRMPALLDFTHGLRARHLPPRADPVGVGCEFLDH